MKKKIKKEIQGKIFCKQDIIRLNNIFWDIFSTSESDNKRHLITFNCEGNESLEFEDTDLSASNTDLLDIKHICHICLSFHDFRNNQMIELNLSEGQDVWNNNLNISGTDIQWVDSKEKNFDEYLDSIKPQNKLFAKYRKLLHHFISVNIGFLILRFFQYVLQELNYRPKNSGEPEDNPIIFIISYLLETFHYSKYVLISLIAWLVGLWVMLFFWDKVEKKLLNLWPSIEFNFGPYHSRTQNNNRKTIGTILSLIVIPILLQCLFLFAQ